MAEASTIESSPEPVSSEASAPRPSEGPELLPVGVSPDSAWARASSAWSTAACASLTARCRASPSRVASARPVVTAAPAATSTVATVPATGNATVAWLTGDTVPVSWRAWSTLARCTVAVR